MKSTELNFVFPVLGMTTDRDLWGFLDHDRLTKCGPRTLKDKMQDRMELVDTDGHRWRVIAVHSTGRVGSVFTRWIQTWLTGVPQFRIEQDLEMLEPLTLSEVQKRVCEAMNAHPDFWCEDDERETVLATQLAEVRAASSISAIHDLLGLDTFEAY